MIDYKDEIFSEEYTSSENTEANTHILSQIGELELTAFSEGTEYSISKPRRIIIKAIIKND